MRYEIKGDTLPVVICYLQGGEKMNVLDVTEYEDGDDYEWRNRQGIWKNVFR